MIKFRSSFTLGGALAGIAAGALTLGAAGSALAQDGRDPAYAAARAAGQVGEKRDGYLGVVAGQDAGIVAMVKDLNNKRRAIYTQKAAGKSTIEEYAFTTGCTLILQTRVGEKYEGLDGSWKTRTGAAPERDPKCP